MKYFLIFFFAFISFTFGASPTYQGITITGTATLPSATTISGTNVLTALDGKVDETNGVLTSGTLVNPTITGTATGGTSNPDALMLSGTAIGTSSNVIYVSKSAQATDTRTGLSKYDVTRPFFTGTGAQSSAVSGDTIIVLPSGTTPYTGSGWQNLGKDGVNWHFINGAQIKNTSSSVSTFIDNNTVMSFSVSGGLDIIIDEPTDDGAYALLSQNAGSDVNFSCNSITGNALTLVYCLGTISLSVKTVEGIGAVGGCIEIGGSGTNFISISKLKTSNSAAMAISGGVNTLSIGRLECVGAGTEGLNVNGGTVIFNGAFIEGGLGEAINFGGGTLTVNNASLSAASTTGPVRIAQTGTGTLRMNNCRIESSHATMSPINILAGTTNKTITLNGCSLIAPAGATYSIISGDAQNVKVSSSVANKLVQTSPVITQQVGTITVSTDVQ